MALIDFYEDLVFMDKRTISDGQGGFEVEYVDGATFKGGISTSTSITTKIAEKDGFTSIYSITTSKNVELDFHDIIKDKKGRIFRITSQDIDKSTPEVSSMSFHQVSAERYII